MTSKLQTPNMMQCCKLEEDRSPSEGAKSERTEQYRNTSLIKSENSRSPTKDASMSSKSSLKSCCRQIRRVSMTSYSSHPLSQTLSPKSGVPDAFLAGSAKNK